MTAVARIGIPARLSALEGADPRVALADGLLQAIVALTEADGVAVEVIGPDDADLARFDGFVLPGGGDVDPALYGGDQDAPVYDVNPEQDAFDLRVLEHARAAEAPVLAVCRGLQVVNVALGGTLHEDLAATDDAHRIAAGDGAGEEGLFAWHEVAVAPGDPLADAYGTDRPVVASAHHQGLRDLGRGLEVVATSDDGLVEAVRATEGSWLLGVQWHPEVARPASADAGDDRRSVPFELLRAAVAERLALADAGR
ncbi:gamma-glutamyl-gamma-aminobutyrate hydrolase family protein [Agrococcus terreus]|uniref:Peptidase C26 n=1 Tax=Agrococcus terreus TaxID=574649 RepID=A0ABQ2KLM4_9MICO|nr:gamma-glutamyl-gamma-aminobutyrate hydrolase family protein [Agrococcus terreus]GGN85770.1 peptidase C26 [Agrococcus terreus]